MINIEYSFTILTPHDTTSAHNATRQLTAKRILCYESHPLRS